MSTELWCVVDDDSISSPFTITLPGNINTLGVKMLIKEKKLKDLVDASELTLWKLNIREPVDPDNDILDRIHRHGDPSRFATRMSSAQKVFMHFANPPADQLHIFVQVRRTAPLKRPGALEIDDSSYSPKKFRTAILPRKWSVNAGMSQASKGEYYFLDPGTQEVTQKCLDAIRANGSVLLHAARASGKTTRLFWLANKLQEMGYKALYVSLEGVNYLGSRETFWMTIGREISAALGNWNVKISSQRQFLDTFLTNPEDPGQRYERVVLLIDEFSELLRAHVTIRNEFLRALRRVKQDTDMYAISSIIAAGTFSIVHMNPTDRGISSFNISDAIHSSNFSKEETERLFLDFAQDKGITIDDDVVSDIWEKSNGHPGMVCLCGRVVSKRLTSLLDRDNLPYRKWQKFPIEDLYKEINAYNTFFAMVNSLCQSDAKDAVQLLRSQFAGFLEEVELQPQDAVVADFLTAEGVLLKPDVAMTRYRMASPLIDGLIRTRVIHVQFPDAPSTIPPTQSDRTLHVLNTLIESIKFFDKELIRLAPIRSHKLSNVPVNGQTRVTVPRESVYDTELMRVLSGWLSRLFNWTITGQWHLKTILGEHKHTDIILQKDENPPIVLELLATGDQSFVKSHIKKTPEYMELLSADEGWIVHFTCEDDYDPVWQSDEELDRGTLEE